MFARIALLALAVSSTSALNVPSQSAMRPALRLPTKPADATPNVLALRGGGVDADLLCKVMAAVYGGFGIFLATIPGVAFGKNSPVSYWTTFGEAGEWFARGFGIVAVSLFTSPFWAGMPTDVLAKVALPMNILFLPLFFQAAMVLPTAKDSTNAVLPFNLWFTQIPLAASILALNIMALM